MSDRVILYTLDGVWKVEIAAWIRNLFAYKSIGTSVTVYTRRRVGGFLGLFPRVDWVETPADSVAISNIYSGLPNGISRRRGWSNTGHAELFEWAVGIAVTVDEGSAPHPSPGAVLDLRRVDGSVEVRIGDEELYGAVTAGH
jgi:hypothetical protein